MDAEPAARWSCSSALVGEKFCVWGGRTRTFPQGLASSVHSFDPFLVRWAENQCRGDPPPGLYYSASASAGRYLYVYGGTDGSKFYNSLHQLDTETWTWKLLSNDGPMKKVACGMTIYDGKVVLFGGCGFQSGPVQPGAEFIQNMNSSDGRGWTNELHSFDLREGIWSHPAVTGTRPPPCSSFSLTMIDDHRAVLFGGQQPPPCGSFSLTHRGGMLLEEKPPGPKGTNDVYLLDLRGMHWRKLDHEGEHCPKARSSHAAVCLDYGGDYPQVLVTGGDGGGDEVVSDAWMLDVQSGNWCEFHHESLQSRFRHSAAVFNFSVELTEVILFGGCPEWPGNNPSPADVPRIANTTVLRFAQQSPSIGEWVLKDIADSKRLRTRQRVRAKVIQESVRKVERAERRATEAEREKEIAEGRAREAESRASEAESRAMIAEGRVAELLEVRVCTQREEPETQWVVERREIQLTDQKLGRGGSATVSVAMFRGARVAAKTIHNEIVSQHNIQLFKREMDMAARIRHPNLLLFIGATLKGEMVILTELMPTSLRRELQREYHMSPRLTISIGLDVARALNYLHLMRPHPLIHRDISSANVLLEPLPNSHWRAKVSDYGTVNLLQQLNTVCPGNPCYSAPEANDPTQQSPKMDIFSFGVLLMEMLTGKFPVARAHLLNEIRHQQLLAVINRCLMERKEERPTASDLISDLTSPSL